MSLRRLRMGLNTVLRLKDEGFFIPYRYAESVRPPLRYPAIESIFRDAEPQFHEMLTLIDGYGDALRALNGPAPQPRFDQDWFPRLDASALYALVRATAPKRLIEVGSGHSTRFAARAVSDGGLATRITAIDPAPRADIASLGVRTIPKTIQEAGSEPFADLASGDVLFIDSSHILMPGTDVDLLFNTIIPALPGGTWVHIHDICLPDAYPPAWAWRGYNEQQAVATMITTGGFEPMWSSRYVATRMKDALAETATASLPLVDGALETSLWLRKR